MTEKSQADSGNRQVDRVVVEELVGQLNGEVGDIPRGSGAEVVPVSLEALPGKCPLKFGKRADPETREDFPLGVRN